MSPALRAVKRTAEPLTRNPPPLVWPLAGMYVGVLLYLFSPYRDRFPAAFLTIAVFGLVPLVVPRARPVPKTIFCPLNWTLVVFFLQLVVVPLLVCFSGPVESVLPFPPTDSAINVALILFAIAFIAFALGYSVQDRVPRRRAARLDAKRWRITDSLILTYLGLGLVGLYLAYRGFGSFLNYFDKAGHAGTPVTPDVANSPNSSTSLVASLFLRPFLGFAIVLLWCRWLERRDATRRIEGVLVTILAAAAVVVTYSTFSYNRGAFVAPLVALLAVYGRRVRQLSGPTLLVLALIAVFSLTAYRYYRTTDISARQAIGGQSGTIIKGVHVDNELQEYGGGPQFTGFLLQQTRYGHNLQYGKTLVASLLSPVPKLGKAFRQSSGTAWYNRLIYGDLGVGDQIMPLGGELFINFWWPGVVVGFGLIGALIYRLQRRFEAASSAAQTFVWQYASVWVSYLVIGGLAPVSQIFIYFFWPAYALVLLRRPRSAASSAAGWAIR